MNTLIKVTCIDQVLTLENTPTVASGGLNEDYVEFSFCSKWDGLEVTAVFWRDEKNAYHVLLDEANCCQVPPEVTAEEGLIHFGVFGVNAAGKQRTSNVLTYRVEKGAITTDTKPSDPTPEIYQQLLTQYAEIVAMYNSKADKVTGAAAGNFAGLDAEGNITDSGKKPTDYIYLIVGATEPTECPVLWFNTSSIPPEVDVDNLLLTLGEDDETVSAELEVGDVYGVDNATVNTEPTEQGVYDFKIL